MTNSIITYFLKILEYFTSNYYEFKVYKKNSINKSITHHDNLNSKICLLMQGPIIDKDNFTFETLKFYKSFNEGIIIFSTWKNQNFESLNKIKKLGIHVIENDMPQKKGIVNINLQIISTNNGLEFAELLKCDYVLKTRSDQRIYEYKNIYNYFLSILKLFPLYDDNILKNRLIISNLNTFQNRLYGISDMFMFGQIFDMKYYWNIPLQENISLPKKILNETYVSYNLGEGAFVMNFFKILNFNPKWNKTDSDYFYSKYFYVINKEEIGLFWFKYKRHDGFNYFNNDLKNNFFSRENTSNWLINHTKFKK